MFEESDVFFWLNGKYRGLAVGGPKIALCSFGTPKNIFHGQEGLRRTRSSFFGQASPAPRGATFALPHSKLAGQSNWDSEEKCEKENQRIPESWLAILIRL